MNSNGLLAVAIASSFISMLLFCILALLFRNAYASATKDSAEEHDDSDRLSTIIVIDQLQVFQDLGDLDVEAGNGKTVDSLVLARHIRDIRDYNQRVLDNQRL